jgi:hypothetical protein
MRREMEEARYEIAQCKIDAENSAIVVTATTVYFET